VLRADTVEGNPGPGVIDATHVTSVVDGAAPDATPVSSPGALPARTSPITQSSGPSTLALLVNAAVPVLALLALVAMVVTGRRRRVPRVPAHIAKHRRKQPLPGQRRKQPMPSSVPTRHR
jgi:hypothetical protein